MHRGRGLCTAPAIPPPRASPGFAERLPASYLCGSHASHSRRGRCYFDAPGNVLCKGIVVADKTTGLTAKRDYSQNPLPLASVPTGFQAGAGAKVFAGVAAVSEYYYAVCYPSGATGSSSSVNFAKVGCSMINMQCGDPAAPATTCTNNAESFPVVVTTVSPPELRYFTPRV